MKGFEEELNWKYNQILEQIEEVKMEIRRLPEGSLRCSGKGSRYTDLRLPGGKYERVCASNPGQVRLMTGIQRRRYLEKTLENLEINKRNLEILIKSYEEVTPAAVCRQLPKVYARIPENLLSLCFHSADCSDQDWIDANCCQNPYHPENLIQQTTFGLVVRTKSEMMIAEMLHSAGLVFRYEPALTLVKDGSQFTRYPDFEIRLPKETSVFWEHAGMVSDPDYSARLKSKLDLYAANGIYPWKNLILTADDENGSLDLEKIDAIVHGLRRLAHIE